MTKAAQPRLALWISIVALLLSMVSSAGLFIIVRTLSGFMGSAGALTGLASTADLTTSIPDTSELIELPGLSQGPAPEAETSSPLPSLPAF